MEILLGSLTPIIILDILFSVVQATSIHHTISMIMLWWHVDNCYDIFKSYGSPNFFNLYWFFKS